MALLHHATLTPTKRDLLTAWLPSRSWWPGGEFEHLGAYRLDDPEGEVGMEGFVLGELHTSLDLLYREVHYLAYHYHWSEREIMEMPRAKRRRYIEVLADEIERLSDAI